MTVSPLLGFTAVRQREMREVVRRRTGAEQLPSAADLAVMLIRWFREGALPLPLLRQALTAMAASGSLDEDVDHTLYLSVKPPASQEGAAWTPRALAQRIAPYLLDVDLEPKAIQELLKRWSKVGVLFGDPGTLDQPLPSSPLLMKLRESLRLGHVSPAVLAGILERAYVTEPAEAPQAALEALDEHLTAWLQPRPTKAAAALRIKGNASTRAPLGHSTDEVLLFAFILDGLLRETLSQQLVGLSLSGGGIRSASFNLGLLQSFVDRRALDGVDYLSTVSGGGYIGSHLSSVFLQPQVTHEENPLRTKKNGSQPPHVKKLLRGGNYLSDPLRFMDRYLAGTLANQLVLISGLVVCCVLAALIWRLLDVPSIHRFLTWISNERLLDWNRPFLPFAILFFAWLLLWGKKAIDSLRDRPEPQCDKVRISIFRLAIGCFLVGSVVWLANPHINMGDVVYRMTRFLTGNQSSFLNESTELRQLSIHRYIVFALLAILFFFLLPTLRPKRLLMSGQPNQSYLRQTVFRTASIAFLCGVPLAVTFVLARYNLSREATRPGRTFVSSDISDWDRFWTEAFADRESERETPASLLLQAMAHDGRGVDPDFVHLQEASGQDDFSKVKGSPRSLRFLEFWEWGALQDRIASRVNDALTSHAVFEAVLHGDRSEFSEKVNQLRKRDSGGEVALAWLGEFSNEAEADRIEVLMQSIDEGEPSGLASIKETNHLILRLFYPDLIRRPTLIRRTVTVQADQRSRLMILAASLAIFLTSATLVNLNSSSPHPFYQQQLAHAYILSHKGKIPQLSSLTEGILKGAPLHVIGATLSRIAHSRSFVDATFILSPVCCGSVHTGFRRTEDYEQLCGRSLNLASAVAISGAAFNPIHIRNLLGAFLMGVLNLRLGQWVPSPAARNSRWCVRPTAMNLLIDHGRCFVTRRRLSPSLGWLILRLRRRWGRGRALCLLTDGGHHENLGVGQLMRRRCAVIIASDAGQDGDRDFADLARLYRRARLEGIRILEMNGMMGLSPAPLNLVSPPKQVAKKQYMIGRVVYPDGLTGILVYIKPALTELEELDLERHSREYMSFPHDPTSDVAYDEDRMESYRQLGYSIGMRVCDELRVLRESLQQAGEAGEERPSVDLRQLAERQSAAASHDDGPGTSDPVGSVSEFDDQSVTVAEPTEGEPSLATPVLPDDRHGEVDR